MYLETIEIQRLRCFLKASVALNYPGRPGSVKLAFPNANLFLGRNGAGKSTFLKALAMAAMAPVFALSGSGFRPYYLVRRNASEARIAATLRLGRAEGMAAGRAEQVDLAVVRRGELDDLTWTNPSKRQKVSQLWAHLYSDRGESPALFAVGYGPGRLEMPQSGIGLLTRLRSTRYQRLASLFEAGQLLFPLRAWLPKLSEKRQGEVREIINRLIGPDVRLVRPSRGDDWLFEKGKFRVPFQALSDGYRTMVSFLGDLLYHVDCVTRARQSLSEVEGLVLIDEVDLFLHPEWQSRVVPDLCRAFPKLQFVMTTHSEIVVGSLQQENIFLLRAKGPQKDQAVIDPAPGLPAYGLDALQLLRTYFDFGGRNPEATAALRDLEVKARRGDAEASMKVMEILAGESEVPPPGDDSPGAAPKKSAPKTLLTKKPTVKTLVVKKASRKS